MQPILTAGEKFENILDQLATLRDDVRVRAHLAGLDARELFQGIDADLHRELALVRARKAVLTNIVQRLQDLRASIHD